MIIDPILYPTTQAHLQAWTRFVRQGYIDPDLLQPRNADAYLKKLLTEPDIRHNLVRSWVECALQRVHDWTPKVAKPQTLRELRVEHTGMQNIYLHIKLNERDGTLLLGPFAKLCEYFVLPTTDSSTGIGIIDVIAYAVAYDQHRRVSNWFTHSPDPGYKAATDLFGCCTLGGIGEVIHDR